MAITVAEAQTAYRLLDADSRVQVMFRFEWELTRSPDPVAAFVAAMEGHLRGDPMPGWGRS